MDKHAKLLVLAKKRAADRWPGYNCIGDYHCGRYECDFVSPISKAAGNVESEILVMLKDWSSDEDMSDPFDQAEATLGYTDKPRQPTIPNLIELLKVTFGKALRDVYATNLFPFIKMGEMTSEIRKDDLVRAAREYALPQIQIIAPKLVICLGLVTFDALRQACGLRRSSNMSSAIDLPFDFEGARIWCQAHTGALGRMNRNKDCVNQVSKDWQRMKADIAGADQKGRS